MSLGMRFKRPLEMNSQELSSVLDCYGQVPKGYWPSPKPRLVAPLYQYEACFELAEYLHLDEEQTVGEYLLSLVQDEKAKGLLEKFLSGEEE